MGAVARCGAAFTFPNKESGPCSQAYSPLFRLVLHHCRPKNACYFFSRLEREGGARFVSYHFTDKPELSGQFTDATDAIKFLTQF